MCGICGFLGLEDRSVVESVNRAMRHRGPDDEGVFQDRDNQVLLGHVRLSIIDPLPRSRQPMTYANGRYCITFNGEIYNYRELKKTLVGHGYAFTTDSDTEVILAAYAQWGDRCIDYLDGMFVFAICDLDTYSCDNLLFLARDRFGIKPLYYFMENGVFGFASELKGLLASGQIERKLDPVSLCQIQVDGSVAQPRSILAQVSMLSPGHVMSVSRDMKISVRKYWNIAEASLTQSDIAARMTRHEVWQHVRQLLEQATARHMVADVPVGAFLSGGMDSSAVVALMKRQTTQSISTYSVGFESLTGMTDERNWARQVSEYLDTDHKEIVITQEDVSRNFSNIVEGIDQPSADGTNTYFVSRLVDQNLKVVLSGLGGDELFAGYPHFGMLQRMADWDHKTRWMGPFLYKLLARIRYRRDGRALNLSKVQPPERLQCLRSLVEQSKLDQVLSKELLACLEDENLGQVNDTLSVGNPIAETSYFELKHYLVNTLLRDVDAMAMHHSLEVRPVLLDHHLAEFIFALPARHHLSTDINKPALAGAIADLLPAQIINRRKMGFELPLHEWLCGSLKERAIDTFRSDMAREIYSERFINDATQRIGNNMTVDMHLWMSFSLLEWIQHSCCRV